MEGVKGLGDMGEVDLDAWVGRREVADNCVTSAPISGLSATLDRNEPPRALGDESPPLRHWLYFLPRHRQSEIGGDGHARRGGSLPPVTVPRRMSAGGRVSFERPLRVGEAIRRLSTVRSIDSKSGKRGSLVFVTVRHAVSGSFGGAISKAHDIVYREAPNLAEPSPAKPRARTDEHWRRDIRPDDVLLFRQPGLTFNGHRIRYDRRYVTQTEGYPGLVVQGPLIAALVADLARREDARPLASFALRAVGPLFDVTPFSVCGAPTAVGDGAELCARSAEGALAMQAEARFRGRDEQP